ncbi:MAG: hypothetical protein ACKER6_00625 [Candidatus Hodgkinia cicadicola]
MRPSNALYVGQNGDIRVMFPSKYHAWSPKWYFGQYLFGAPRLVIHAKDGKLMFIALLGSCETWRPVA